MLIPEVSVMFNPLLGRFKRLGFQANDLKLATSFTRNQVGAFKHFQMLGNSCKGHAVRFGNFSHSLFLFCKSMKNAAPGGVCQCVKNVVKTRG